jgi:hypothetical protein
MATITFQTVNAPIYRSNKYLDWAEYNLTIIALCLGVDFVELEQMQIDEILERIKSVYGYGENYPAVSLNDEDRSISAAAAFMRNRSKFVKINARRYWRMLSIAKQEVLINE